MLIRRDFAAAREKRFIKMFLRQPLSLLLQLGKSYIILFIMIIIITIIIIMFRFHSLKLEILLFTEGRLCLMTSGLCYPSEEVRCAEESCFM